MNVAGVQFHGLVDQFVDGAHHRRAAGQIAQIVEIVLLGRADGLGRGGVVRLAERGGDVLERGDDDFDRRAEHEFRRLARLSIHRVAHRQDRPAVGGGEGKDGDVAQEPGREPIGERRRACQFGQRRLAQGEELGRGRGDVVA